MRRVRLATSVLAILFMLTAAGAQTARAAGSCSDLMSPLQNLARCNLNHASLTSRLALADSNLRGANLNQAEISGEAALLGTKLGGANLNHVRVTGQDALVRAGLVWANLDHSQFSAAAIGVAADLRGANLEHAQIGGLGDLTAADLRGADLSDATISGIGALTGADVRGASLRGATVSGLDVLKFARYFDTTCPDGTNSNRNGGTCAGHLNDPVCPSCGGGGGSPPPPPSGGYTPPPGTVLGGLNLDSYCQSSGFAYSHVPGVGAHFANVEFGANQAFLWDCVNSSGTAGTPLNMQAACNAQYGAGAIAFVGSPNDAYSWTCVSAPSGSFYETSNGNTYLADGGLGGGGGSLPDFVFLGADNTLVADGGLSGGGSLPDFVSTPGDGSSVTFSTPSGGFIVAESGSLATGGAI
jgi:uncharacterized protein YjbI with pentapeptide repeats